MLHTFPKDPCTMVCETSGGFKKSPLTTQQMLDKKRESEYTKHLADNEAYKIIAQQVSQKKEEDITTTNELNETPENNLVMLKPGGSGKINWTPLAALTGTRPSVNKYSLSRFSLDEWRKYNEAVLDTTKIAESNILAYNTLTAINAVFGNIDKGRKESNRRLKEKAKDLYRWKVEVETACNEITKEVELLEIERQRIKCASRVLMLPEAISKECIELRSNRAKTDLVADAAEEELRKEMSLVNEVRETLRYTLKKIEEQLDIDKAAKHRIEYDWCDKDMAYTTDTINLSLNTKSNTLMFKPGATKFSDHSAPQCYWEYFCRDNIENVEAVRQRSSDLRSTLNAILINNGRKLREQADKTDKALAETVALTTELVTEMEELLRNTLRSLADMELLIQNLQNSIRKSDCAMKLAQTRLDNRNIWRPHGENVRDNPHVGLIHEVKTISQSVTTLLTQLNNAEQGRNDLMEKRREIEKMITTKRKSLIIDQERCGMIRSHYPTASELAGL